MPQAQQKGPSGEIARFATNKFCSGQICPLQNLFGSKHTLSHLVLDRKKWLMNFDCCVYLCDSRLTTIVNLVHCPSKTPSGTTGTMSFECSIATKARQSHGQICILVLPILYFSSNAQIYCWLVSWLVARPGSGDVYSVWCQFEAWAVVSGDAAFNVVSCYLIGWQRPPNE